MKMTTRMEVNIVISAMEDGRDVEILHFSVEHAGGEAVIRNKGDFVKVFPAFDAFIPSGSIELKPIEDRLGKIGYISINSEQSFEELGIEA